MPQAGAPARTPYPPDSTAPAMAFVKEVPSDEALERYGSLLNLNHSRLWVADHERQIFLWGGQTGNPYFDDLIEGVFRLLYKDRLFEVVLLCHEWRLPSEDGISVLNWDSLSLLYPLPGSVGLDRDLVLAVLRDAVRTLGSDALFLGFGESLNIRFGF